jgi:rare lipoprotein A
LPEKSEDPTFKPYVINGIRYYPLPDSEGFRQSGKASWYGAKFHGRPTSSGEIYDMYKVSAAHKTLPLGTHVKVLNLSNNRKIIVRINDRGPFVKGRIIDLSYAGAKKIGLVGPGVAEVEIVALGKEVGELKTSGGIKPVVEISDLQRGVFAVQVGAFKDRNNALRLAERLKVIFDNVDVTVYDEGRGPIHRVRVSKSDTLTKAGEVEKKLENMGFEEAFVGISIDFGVMEYWSDGILEYWNTGYGKRKITLSTKSVASTFFDDTHQAAIFFFCHAKYYIRTR